MLSELPAEVDDVARDQLGRIDAQLDRVVLAVDAEGVEPDRLEDVVALEPLEPAVHVAPVKANMFPTCSPSADG